MATTPKLSTMTVRTVCVPHAEPHRTASGVITESPLVLVDLGLDNGETGRSLVFTYTRAALKPVAEFMRNLWPMIEGDALAPVEIEQKLAARFRLLGTQGLVGMGLAGLDMALWDAMARVQGLSLARLLGGAPKPIRTYGAVGYDGPAGSARAAEAWARAGFPGAKAKVGYSSAAEDLAVIRAMREATGPDFVLMVDYNQSLSPAEAIQRMRVLDEAGLLWVEEPTLAHDFAGHAAIAAAAQTPIQCGENWWGVRDLQHALDARASDYVMLDVMKVGGPGAWMRGAALAHAKSIPLSSHFWPELSAQLLSASPGAHWLEYSDWWKPVLREPLAVERGFAITPDAPGSGIDWNEAAIAKYLV
jgi:mandelate racemase